MKVRDHTKKLSEYKGRWTDASDAACPCRPCYNAHNCSSDPRTYWEKPLMSCATRWNHGCPSSTPEPEHDLNRQRYCRRCRVRVPKAEVT